MDLSEERRRKIRRTVSIDAGLDKILLKLRREGFFMSRTVETALRYYFRDPTRLV